ncbi:c-type cytochrome [Frigidibacter albus]|uniref:C-type cytochrome n=1 Tax=Frigidibacter albus TaxID=1465486 RepID=A0A6L8VH13_9RHOB|nr:cytochrome c [Frigidibacter albus]MZQ89011.1 c-type cytochrome [Frigidibacter albus]NBE30932.1 c-type cytochrome [Frigidibacter albus]GGH51950.1 hypothetical protein GCM10011341_15980 [Frigidibacter albus]
MRYGSGLAIVASATAALLAAACAVVPPETGERAFAEHCVSCHGITARGDGPAAAGLPVPDLTGIAARNGGVFPRAAVMTTIDGYSRGLHGEPGAMPQFGDLLRGRTVLYDSGDGIATPTPETLVALAEYLQRIQG